MSFVPGRKVEECYTEECLHCRQLLEDLTHDWNLPTETKVACRNARVRTAIVFIAALSLCTASLILTMILLSCCAIVLKAWFKSVLTGRISSSPTYQVYFITQSCFIGFGPSPQGSRHLDLKAEMVPGAPRDNRVGVNVRPSRVREPFMLTKDTGHSVYRHVKSFGGVDRVPCKVMKQWKVRPLLRSVQSVLEVIVNPFSLSSRGVGQQYQFSHSDNVSKGPNRFVKELDHLINNSCSSA